MAINREDFYRRKFHTFNNMENKFKKEIAIQQKLTEIRAERRRFDDDPVVKAHDEI